MNPNHVEEQAAARARRRANQRADQIAKGTYVPTKRERMDSAISALAKLGATADQIRELIYASVYAFREGTTQVTSCLHPSEIDEMLDRHTRPPSPSTD